VQTIDDACNQWLAYHPHHEVQYITSNHHNNNNNNNHHSDAESSSLIYDVPSIIANLFTTAGGSVGYDEVRK
jgi:hypothetical protein